MIIKRKLYSNLIPVKAGSVDSSVRIIGKKSKNLSKSLVQKVRNNYKNIISKESLPKGSNIISSSTDKDSSLALLGVRNYVKSGKYKGKGLGKGSNSKPKIKIKKKDSKIIAKGSIIDRKLGKNSYLIGKINLRSNGIVEHLPNTDGQLSLFRPGEMSYKI